MPSEHALHSPLTTVNTVCGRSREMARPRALRYLFSWRRLESSCSLENKSGVRVRPIYSAEKTKTTGKAADLAITVKEFVVLVNKCPHSNLGIRWSWMAPGVNSSTA